MTSALSGIRGLVLTLHNVTELMFTNVVNDEKIKHTFYMKIRIVKIPGGVRYLHLLFWTAIDCRFVY